MATALETPLMEQEPFYKEAYWGRLLPTWAYCSKVGDIAQSLENANIEQPVPLQCVLGPTVKQLIWANVIYWLVFLALPWLTLLGCRCGGPKGYAQEPSYMLMFMAPLMVVFLYYEWQCLRSCIVPLRQVVGHFRLFVAPLRVRYETWLVVGTIASIAAHLDVITTGVFLAITMKTMHCSAGEAFDDFWRHDVMAQSVFLRYVPVRFDVLVMLLWALMMFQPLTACVECTPLIKIQQLFEAVGLESFYVWLARKCHFQRLSPVSYDMCQEGAVIGFCNGGVLPTMYHTVQHEKDVEWCDHGAAMFSLADLSRMATVVSMSRAAYYQGKRAVYLEQKQFGPAFGLTRRQLLTGFTNAIQKGLLESGFALNIQVTLLGMNYHFTDAIDKGMLFKVVIAMGVAMMNMFVSYTEVRKLKSVVMQFRINDGIVHLDLDIFCSTLERLLDRYLRGLALYYVFVLYAFVKFLAVHLCDDHAWNISGCVNGTDTRIDISLMTIYALSFFGTPYLLSTYSSSGSLKFLISCGWKLPFL